MDKAARAALLTAKGINGKRAAYVDGGGSPSTGNPAMFEGVHHYLTNEDGSLLDLWHGTTQNKEFEAFDNSKLGARDAGFYGRGHYLTPDNVGAEEYANSGNTDGTVIGPLHTALKNPYIWDVSSDMKVHSTLRDLQSMGIMREKKELDPWDNLQRHHIEPFMAEMRKRGHDGVLVKTDNESVPNGISEVVVFNPNTIKHKDAEVFDPNDPRIRRDDGGTVGKSTGGAMEFARHVEAVNRAGGQIAPSKYLPDVPRQVHAGGGRIHANGGGVMDLRSKAAQVIRNQPQAKGNVDQMLAMMAAKGVKPSELVNAGRPFGHSVSKEELAKHFEDAVPKVNVERLGGKDEGLTPEEEKEFSNITAPGMPYPTGSALERYRQLSKKLNVAPTRYGKYTLPEGENYREHLLTIPNAIEEKNKIKQQELAILHEKAVKSGDRDLMRQLAAEYNDLNAGDVDTNFRSAHWDTPNVLAHLRMKDRDNGKTLHVEEVQSDWGQKGREQGFYDPQKPIEVFHTGTGQTVHATDDMGEAKAIAEKLGPQYDYGHQDDEKVPQGPYVGNTQHWTDLAVKHALTEAAKGGHDRVVFSPGEANADLYGQRHHISDAYLAHDQKNPEALGNLFTFDKASGQDRTPILVKDEKHLQSLLGKKHASAILSKEPTNYLSPTGERYLSGEDMVLGGHGMADYYNNIVHPAALKLLRQHDPSIQPESYDLPNGYKGFALPMTDKARQSILDNGFQAFKDGGTVDDNEDDGITAYHGSAYDFPQFDISKLGTGTGHQAYGHGLYFAGDENDAKNYREMLKNNGSIDIEHESHKLGIPLDRDAQADLRSVSRNVNGDPAAAARALQARNLAARAMPQEKLADLIDRHRKSTSGHMYKVKLNVKPEELLDWNKPLSEQHPNVQAALSRTMPDYTIKNMAGIPHAFANGKMIEVNPNGLTGRDAYVLSRMGKSTESSNSHQDAKAASEHLLSEGIKGIRYKEGGGYNYVMFHHDPVQVVDKYEYGGTVGKEDGGAMGDGITAYHGSPYSFDQFDISKLGTGEGNQSYGHGLYFAGNEKVAKYYRDALTDPEQTHLHFDQRPVDTPWNEEIRARWPEHFAGKSQRDQDAMEEALGNLSQVNNLKDVPNALSNMSAAAKYMYQRHIKPKLTKPDLGKGHMYKVQLQVKPSELLDWDKPLSEQHPEVQKALNENLRKSNNLKKFMIENPTGGELHEALSDKGSYRDQISASEQLLAAGLKGIKYRDADSRDLSDGDATHNYVMFHHDPIKVMSKYEYGGAIDAALALTRRFTKDGNAATASLKKKPL